MPGMEKLNPEVIEVSGGELKRIAEELAALARSGGLAAINSEPLAALLHEAWGAATLCQLHGLRLLFEDAAGAVRAAGDGALEWDALEASLRDIFQLLPRLLDWLVRSGRDNPCLLIPEISTLRALRGRPPVYEYQVLPDLDWARFSIPETTLAARTPEADLRRVLHLYQLGLVNVLRNQQRDKGFDILTRCAGRLAHLSVSETERNYWTIYQLVLQCFAEGRLRLRVDRQRLLAAVEKQLRSLSGARTTKAGNPYPEGLWRAFLALLSMSAEPAHGGALRWLQLPAIGFRDEDLERIRSEVFDRGEAVESRPMEELAERAQRLRNCIDAAQDGRELAGSALGDMRADCQQVAQQAGSLGLDNIARRFQHHADTLGERPDGPGWLAAAEAESYAESVLYLECALADFAGDSPSEAALASWGRRSLDEVLANDLAGAARTAALLEATAVLRDAKRQIETLQDGIISDDSWRDIDLGFQLLDGAAKLLALEELASIFQRAREFVQTSRYHPELGLNDRSRNLDLFADMVIGLEVYLDSLRLGRDEQEGSLSVAAECAQALNF